MIRNLLVIGARPGSLGAAVAELARDNASEFGYQHVFTAGLHSHGEESSRRENYGLDLTITADVREFFKHGDYRDVVCTVGINWDDDSGTWGKVLKESMAVNAIGPLYAAKAWAVGLRTANSDGDSSGQFVAIGSNSAHIARSRSVAYCASKAALGAGLRSLGRRLAQEGQQQRIWGYEPGWLDGTPMSDRVVGRLAEGVAPHRIPGGSGISVAALASRILFDLNGMGASMNGTMQRFDGGDQ